MQCSTVNKFFCGAHIGFPGLKGFDFAQFAIAVQVTETSRLAQLVNR